MQWLQEQMTFVFITCIDTVGDAFKPLHFQCEFSQKQKHLNIIIVNDIRKEVYFYSFQVIVQELCESRGGHPGLSVLTSLLVSVDVKNY